MNCFFVAFYGFLACAFLIYGHRVNSLLIAATSFVGFVAFFFMALWRGYIFLLPICGLKNLSIPSIPVATSISPLCPLIVASIHYHHLL